MPTLSMFYGILIKMFNNGEHNPPHFHAEFQNFKAKFTLDGELMVGEMPRGKVKLIQAWAELHKDELFANWELAINEEPLYKIEPLH
jgi:hypothetical protein